MRRKSAQALAKKVWNMVVLKNKDQKKSSVRSKISDDDSSNDDRHTLSISSKDSIQSEPQMADPDAFVTEDDGSCCIIDTVEHTYDGEEHVTRHDDSISDTEKENEPLLETALKVNLDESMPEDVGLSEGNEKAESEERLGTLTLKDDASCASQEESRSQTSDQTSCLEELNEENVFVEGAAVHIIKGTNKGKCGIISRVTSKCVFISISGFDKHVRKTKSNEFLQLSHQKRSCDKQQDNSCAPEIFLQGNRVRIKRGTNKECQGIISRTTEKCVFISIKGFPQDVRKKKSTEFLQLLNDGAGNGLQKIDEQACAEEISEANAFVVGSQVRVVKGNHLGQCGVISRVTKKSAFVSIEGLSKDIRKWKSDKFLQMIN